MGRYSICEVKFGFLDMANIGVAKASYYADLSVKKYTNEAIQATERIASNKSKSSAGERVSLSNMEDRLRLDIATKNGAIKSMSVAQGYLLATAHALDAGNYLLKKIHDLAVEASNGNATAEELSALDVGAEILGDEFHLHMTSANYKGKPVFQENDHELSIGTGLENGAIKIGVGMIEYDDFYDHINSPENYINSGRTYEILQPLSDDQKETILARTEGLTADDLTVGAQFTVLEITPSAAGAGIRANDLWYTDGDGSVPFDTTAVVSHASSFGSGYLDIEITDNDEASDDFNVVSGDGSAGTISVNAGVVSYIDPISGAIEIGEIDATRDGQNGTALRINFYPDATIPGTSNLLNGNFDGGATNWNAYTDQVNFGSSFNVNGTDIPTPPDAIMAETQRAPGTINNSSNSPPENDNGGLSTNPTYSASIVYDTQTSSDRLKLDTSSFRFNFGNGPNSNSNGVLHGPASVSDPFQATEGDYLKLDYEAAFVNDWYHVASYLVDSSGSITMALNEFGKSYEGTVSIEVPKTDTYQFVFVSGTWDQSGGKVAGASMFIDNIRAERPYEITDSHIQELMRSTNYSSTSNNQEYVKDVLITANDGSDTLSDTSKIFNTEFEYKIMVAPTMDLERPVSTGASNNLSPDGSRDPYVIVSKTEEVKDRIDIAKAMVRGQYEVLDQAIEAATDVRAEFFWGQDAISNHEAFADTAYFAKQQIMQDSAAAMFAQANVNQSGLMKLIDK